MSTTDFKTWAQIQSNILQKVRENIYHDMPVQQFQILCEIAANPGISGVEIRKKMDIPGGSLSRNLKQLSKHMYKDRYSGKTEPRGYDLLDIQIDPYETRARVYRLNAKGKALMKEILGGVIKHSMSMEGRNDAVQAG